MPKGARNFLLLLACLTPSLPFGQFPFPNQCGARECQPAGPACFTDVLVSKWGESRIATFAQILLDPAESQKEARTRAT